jgi:hypothetical protein
LKNKNIKSVIIETDFGKTIKIYDTEARLIKETDSIRKKNRYKLNYQIDISYDSSTNQELRISRDNKLKIIEIDSSKFNDRNLLIYNSISTFNPNKKKQLSRYSNSFTYLNDSLFKDDYGNFFILNKNQNIVFCRTSFQTDSVSYFSDIDTVTKTYWYKSKSINDSVYRIGQQEYYLNNLLIQLNTYDKYYGGKIIRNQRTYTYDTNKNLIREEDNNLWKERTYYVYKNGLLFEKIIRSTYSSTYVIKYKYEYY